MSSTPEIDIERFAAARPTGTVVDVRERHEYAAGHVGGALLIPMGQLPSRVRELDRAKPVYVICATGNRSLAMTDLLRAAGFNAWSVTGGTSRLGPFGPPRRGRTPMSSTTSRSSPIETPTLGDRSYLVHDGEVAFVVDPQRDIDRVLDLLEEHSVRLTDVFETHIHNDYVTGGLALARRTGAAYHVNAADEVSFERSPIRDAQTVEVGSRMRVTALATPGHTFTHLSYALTDADDRHGWTRPIRRRLLRRLAAVRRHRAPGPARRRAHRCPGASPARVGPPPGRPASRRGRRSSRPTASGRSARPRSPRRPPRPSGRRRSPTRCSPRTRRPTSASCSTASAPGRPTTPTWRPPTRPAPREPDLSPPALADATELRRRIEAGEWVVDLRNRTAFAAGHARGTLNFGLDGAFATYLGWLIPWGTPVTLLGETAEDVAEAQRELVRIGIDRPAAHATGGPEDWTDGELASFPTATFADLAAGPPPPRGGGPGRPTQRGVRRRARSTTRSTSRSTSCRRRVDEVPAGEVWVHCAAGYRASVAASMLDAAGRTLVAIDDSFDNAEKVGLHLVGPEAA